MLKKALLATALTLVSSVALANPPHWAPAHGYRAHHYYYPAYRPVYVVPAYRPVYVVPRPVYAPAVPIAPGISIRLNFPL